MNKIFKVIWSNSLNELVVTSELSRGYVKASSSGMSTASVKESTSVSLSKGSAFGLLGATLVAASLFTVTDAYAVTASTSINGVFKASSDASGAFAVSPFTSGETGGNDATAVGNSSFALGTSATAYGNGSMAIGLHASANLSNVTKADVETGRNISSNKLGEFNPTTGRISRVAPIAIGSNSTADAANGIAIGTNANTTGNRGIAIGSGSKSIGDRAVALGWQAYANDWRSTALGTQANATGNLSTAVGQKAFASEYATALGSNASANAISAVALGDHATINEGAIASIAIGLNSTVGSTAVNSIAMGYETSTPKQNSVAIGTLATTETADSIAIGLNAKVLGTHDGTAVAIGANSKAENKSALALGNTAEATGAESAAFGSVAKASGTSSLAMGSNSKAEALSSVAVGNTATASGDRATALGQGTKALSRDDTAIGAGAMTLANAGWATAVGIGAKGYGVATLASGYLAEAKSERATALGAETLASEKFSTAVGVKAKAEGESSIAVGYQAMATKGNSISIGKNASSGDNTGTIMETTDDNNIAIGTNAKAREKDTVAIGNGAEALKDSASALGRDAQATDSYATAIGNDAKANKIGSVALGSGAKAGVSGGNGSSSTALGNDAEALHDRTVALGNKAKAEGEKAIAIGADALASGSQSISIGTGNEVSGNNSGALGDPSYVSGSGTYTIGNNNGNQGGVRQDIAANNAGAFGNENLMGAGATGSRIIGNNNNIQQADTFVVGNNVTTTQGNSVILGSNSTDRAATTEATGAISGITYGNFAGQGAAANGVVSIGRSGAERQIINVAAGKISSDSTDAINGSQLYATNSVLGNALNSLNTLLGGDAYVVKSGDNAGNFSMSNIGGTGKNNIHEAIQAAATGWNIQGNGVQKDEVKGGDIVNFVNGTGTTANVTVSNDNVSTVKYSVDTTSLTVNNGNVQAGDSGNKFATAEDVANAINNASGNTTTVNSTGGTIAVTPSTTGKVTNYDLDLSDDTKAQIQQGVEANRTVSEEGIKFSADNGSPTTRKLGEELEVKGDLLITTTASEGRLNVTATTKLSNAVASAESAVQTLKTSYDNKEAQTLNKTDNSANFISGTNIQLSGSATGITIATQENVTFRNVNATNVNVSNVTASNTIAVTNGPALTTAGINAANKKITNVSNGTNANDAVNFSQLNATNANVANNTQNITNNTNAIANNTAAINKGINVGNGTNANQFALGDTINVTSDSNMVVETVTDGVKLALAKNLTGLESAVFGGNTTINGDGLTITNGPSVTKDGINAGNKAITNVTAGTNGTDAVNLTQLNASKSSVQAGNNVNVTATTDANGTVYTVTANGTRVSNGSNSITVTATNAGNNVTDYAVDLSQQAKDDIQAGVTANETVNSKGITFSADSGSSSLRKLGDTLAINGDSNLIDTTVTEGKVQVAASAKLNNAVASAESALQSLTTSADGTTAQTLNKDSNNANFISGKNIALTPSATGITVATKEDVTFTNVTAANITANDSISVTNGPSLTATGIDAANKKITNVSNGTDANDAVNFSQLNATNANVANNTQNITANAQNITTNAQNIQSTKDGLNATNATVANNTQNIADNTANITANKAAIADNAAEIAKGWNLTTSGNTTGTSISKVAMGDSVTLDGGANIQLTQDGKKVTIATSMTPTFTTVTATDKVTIGQGGNTTDLTSTSNGLDVGGDKITNVSNGTQDSDAVNLSQLNATNANVANNTQNITNNTRDIANNTQNITNNTNAIKANADNIAKGIKFGNATTNNTYALGDELAVEGDVNIISNTTNKGVALTLAKNLTNLTSAVFGGNTTIDGDGLTITGGPSITKEGIDAGSQKITNVLAGTNGTDAVNLDQLNSSIAASAYNWNISNGTASADVPDSGTVVITGSANANSAATSGVVTILDGTNVTVDLSAKAKDALGKAESALQSWTAQVNGAEAKVVDQTDNTVDFIDGKNISITNDNGKIKVATADNVTFTNVNATDVNATNVSAHTVTVGSGSDTTTLTSTANGLDVGGDKITNVANGTQDSDAVNLSQLNATNANVANNTRDIANNAQNITNNANAIKANADEIAKGWRLTTGGNTTGTSEEKVAMGDLVTLDGGANIQLTQEGKKISIATSMTPTFTTVTATDKVTIGKDGNTTDLTSTAEGLDVGGDKITNVSAGAINSTSTDAVNGSQLYDTAKSMADVLGGGAGVDTNGKVIPPTFAVTDPATGSAQNYNSVASALNALNTATNKPLTFTGNDGSTEQKLGSTLNIVGSMAAGGSSKNIRTNVTANNVEILMAENPEFTGVDLVSGGNTVKLTPTADGLSIAKADGSAAKLTNVATATNGTDAVNLDQLNSTLVGSKWSLKTSQDGAAETTVGEINPNDTVVIDGNGVVKVTHTAEAANGVSKVHIGIETQAVEFADGLAKIKGNSTASGTDTGASNPNALTTAGDVVNVVNNAAAALTAKGLDFVGNQGDKIHKDLGQQLTIKGNLTNTTAASADNIRVDSENGELVVKIAEAPTFTAVTATDKVTIGQDGNTTNLTSTADGLDVGGDKITNVAEGAISSSSKEVINGSQLFNATTATAAALGTTVNPTTGELVAPTYNVYGGTVNNVADAVKDLQEKSPITYVDADGNATTTPSNSTALRGADADTPVSLSNVASGLGDTALAAASGQMLNNAVNVGDLQKATTALTDTGWKLQTNTGDEATVKLGETVQVVDGANTKVSSVTSKDGKHTYQIDVTGLPIAFTNEAGEALVKVGDTYYKASDMDPNGQPKADAEEQTPANTSLVNQDGTPTEMTLSNVRAGKVTADSRDAVNGSQLFNATTATAAALGTTVNPTTGELVAPTYNVYGGTVNNVADAVKDLQEKSPITYVDADGNATTTPSNSTALRGADATKPVGLTNVANATVAQDSLDAVNGGQLFAQGEGVKNILGGNTVYDPATGTYTNNDIGGTGQSTVHDAIKAVNDTANQGWNLTANGKDNSTVKPGNTVDLNNSDGNIVISKTGHNITFNLNPDLNVSSVTTGDTTMNNEGVKVGDQVSLTKDGLTAGNVSVTTAGINAGGNKITGVAAGDISAVSTDAVNGSQLHQVAQASRTEVKQGDNIVVTSETGANGQAIYTVATAKEVNFDKVTVGNVTIDNITNKVSGVSNGDISASSSDVVNGSQLHNANQNVANYLGGGSTVDSKGDVTAPIYNVVTDPATGTTTTANNVGDAINHLGVAVSKPLTFTGDSGSDSVMKLGSTVSIKGGVSDSVKLADDNIGVVSDGAGNLTVKLAKDVQGLNSVTTGDTKVNSDGIVINNGATGSSVSLSKNGLNNGGNKITNVAAGTVSKDSTDAVNGSQLYHTNEAIAKVVAGGAGIIQYSNADNPTVPNGGVASNDVTLVGADKNAPVALHNVAAGRAPTDAVNVAQLNDGLGKVNNRVSKLDKRVRGIGANSAAAASLPQVYIPGKSMVAASGGAYGGASAIAIGFSRASDNGKIILKATGTANSAGHYSGGVGVGYQW